MRTRALKKALALAAAGMLLAVLPLAATEVVVLERNYFENGVEVPPPETRVDPNVVGSAAFASASANGEVQPEANVALAEAYSVVQLLPDEKGEEIGMCVEASYETQVETSSSTGPLLRGSGAAASASAGGAPVSGFASAQPLNVDTDSSLFTLVEDPSGHPKVLATGPGPATFIARIGATYGFSAGAAAAAAADGLWEAEASATSLFSVEFTDNIVACPPGVVEVPTASSWGKAGLALLLAALSLFVLRRATLS